MLGAVKAHRTQAERKEALVSDIERWSYFLIPLPDPLGLKDGSVYRAMDQIEPELDGAFEPAETRISASVLIHQVDSKVNEFSAAHDYSGLVKKIWPEQSDSDSNDERGDFPNLEITKTIAEVAVSPLDDKLRRHLDRNDDRPELYHQFEIALEAVNRLIEEYRVVAKTPVRLVTAELLPFLIPRAYGDVNLSDGTDPTNFETGIYMLSPRKHYVAEEFTDDQFAKLSNNLELSSLPHPLKSYISVRNDASIAYNMHGDYRMSVILIATACEILINVVLQSLMWEAGQPLKTAAKVFRREVSVSEKLRKFGNYFGPAWDAKKTPELVRWTEDIAYKRNDVVHTGAKPTPDEVDRAWDAMDGLFRLLERSLIEKFQRYPRTLTWFIGDRLKELPLDCEQFVKEIQILPEPNWTMLLSNWSAAISRTNRKPDPVLPCGPPRIVISREAQATWWIITDSTKSHASFVQISDIVGLKDELFGKIVSVRDQKLDSPPNSGLGPLVLAFTALKIRSSFVPDWKPIHELDPMRSYSLDKAVTIPHEDYLVPFD